MATVNELIIDFICYVQNSGVALISVEGGDEISPAYVDELLAEWVEQGGLNLR